MDRDDRVEHIRCIDSKVLNCLVGNLAGTLQNACFLPTQLVSRPRSFPESDTWHKRSTFEPATTHFWYCYTTYRCFAGSKIRLLNSSPSRLRPTISMRFTSERTVALDEHDLASKSRLMHCWTDLSNLLHTTAARLLWWHPPKRDIPALSRE